MHNDYIINRLYRIYRRINMEVTIKHKTITECIMSLNDKEIAALFKLLQAVSRYDCIYKYGLSETQAIIICELYNIIAKELNI